MPQSQIPASVAVISRPRLRREQRAPNRASGPRMGCTTATMETTEVAVGRLSAGNSFVTGDAHTIAGLISSDRDHATMNSLPTLRRLATLVVAVIIALRATVSAEDRVAALEE